MRTSLVVLPFVVVAVVEPLRAQAWRLETGRPLLYASSIVYDAARGQIVRFGGDAVSSPGPWDAPTNSDTWVRDATGWHAIVTAHAPSARGWHGLVFDSARQRVVLFGGLDRNYLPLGDTWEFDGRDWTQVPTAQSPSPGGNLPIAYDVARQRVVLYGGRSGSYNLVDTWEFDGSNWSLSPAVGPTTQTAYMTYVPNQGRCILVMRGATWSYDGTSWTQLAPLHSPPEPGQLAVDPTGHLMMVCTPGSQLPETWRFDGVDWLHVTTALAWHPQELPMALDSQRGRVVRVGEETSEFDGVAWTVVEPSRLIPVRSGAALAFDAVRNRVVLFGGLVATGSGSGLRAEHWEWDGLSWSLVPQSLAPSPRVGSVMAYDSRRRRLVLQGGYGGTHLADTWEYDGQVWTQVVTAHAPVHELGAMVYDSVLGRCVLYAPPPSSSGLAPATWTYDGSDWVVLATTQEPPARRSPSMAFDAARNVVVLHGGLGSSWFADTWELRAGDWVRRNPQIRPPGGTGLATFDLVAGRMNVAAATWQGHLGGLYEFDGVLWHRLPGASPPPLLSADYMTVFDPVRQRTLTISLFGEVWSYERAPLASWARLGVGCTQGAVRPELDAVAGSTPQLGGALTLQVTGLPPQPGALWLAFGLGLATWNGVALPVPLGVLGLPECLAWIEPTALGSLVVHNGGTAVTALAVPALPALAGLQFGVQGLGLDASRPFGLGWLTNAGVGTIH